jgi:NAD(P)-dependent dehydrogenase (short-subunit alcohol dehydrogenase family)
MGGLSSHPHLAFAEQTTPLQSMERTGVQLFPFRQRHHLFYIKRAAYRRVRSEYKESKMADNSDKKTEDLRSVALITGALTGIGRATALAFGQQSYRVVISGRKENVGAEFFAELQRLGVEAQFIRADVRQEDDVARLIDATLHRFGRLDAAVNCAGYEGKSGPISALNPEEYRAVFDTNVLGTLLCMKHEMRAMTAQGLGSIVNISSTMGVKGAAGASLYTGSKHAVEGITKSAALEAAPYGVRVNAVAPGPVETEMLDRFLGGEGARAALIQGVPMKRVGTPEEIARMIVFVASNQVPFMTGEIVRVNGGRTA